MPLHPAKTVVVGTNSTAFLDLLRALAANLVEGKRFTAAQWSQALGEEIRRAVERSEPDNT